MPLHSVNDDHLAAGLVRLHDAVRLMNLAETEDPHRLDVEPTGRGVRGDLVKRHVRERKAGGSEHEAAEEGQIDAARHLQHRVEVGNGIETAKPAGETGATAAAKHGEGVEHDAVAHQVEDRIDLLRLGDVLRQITLLDFAAFGAQLVRYREATAIAGRRNHPHAGVAGDLERRLAERRRRATYNEQLSFLDLQIAEEAGPGSRVSYGNRRELGPRQIRFDERDV